MGLQTTGSVVLAEEWTVKEPEIMPEAEGAGEPEIVLEAYKEIRR